ncbi:MAG TPA: tetratricopeptide repeat protein, partial [Thermoanaerobacterales bacterium]|nr:tetratricopeptide repeat protein [Thermoanaerobacterales bacterium]
MTKKEAYIVLINLKNVESSRKSKLDVHLIWTSFLFWAGKYERALNYIQKISEKNNTIETYCWKGVLYYFLKDYSNAVYFLEKAEDINPKCMEVKYFLAEIFFAMAYIEKAEPKYRALTGNSSYKTWGLYGIGCCMLKENRHYESLAFLNKSLSLA